MHFLNYYSFIYFLFLQEIQPNAGAALCSLWHKIPPFVPKSTFFGSLKTFQETPEIATLFQNVCYHHTCIFAGL
jgi:hypothetical protein